MNKFVRSSKYRHLFGNNPKRPEGIYDNLKVSKNVWDSNLVSVNGHFVVTNLEPVGSFSVLPLEQLGKVPDTHPIVTGHGGAVLDTACNPFNDWIVASGSEDQKCMIWKIPEEGLKENLTTPVLTLSGHSRRVGVVSFHPIAENVLATASGDMTVKLWDITNGSNKQTMEGHTDVILGLGWNWDGSKFVTTAKDKQMNIYDAHSGQIVQHVEPHAGAKGSRAIYLGDSNYILTTGFSKQSDRQISVWDERNLSEALNSTNIDIGSGMLMPFYDAENKVVYVASRGSGQIRFYEFGEDNSLFYLSGTFLED
jgi:coronin-1B/1C/6